MSDYYLPSPAQVDVAQLTSQLVRLPSVNPMGGAFDPDISYEWRVTDYLERLAQHWGYVTERQTVHPATDGRPARENLLVCRQTARQDPRATLLYEVHQDTVPVVGMTIPPWGGDVGDGIVRGRGSCDIKGGMASMLVAMARLMELPPESYGRVVWAFTVNEEHGFSGAAEVVRQFGQHASSILPAPPKHAIVSEPTLLQVVVAHKGTVRWECHTHGRAAHSSAPKQGHNAIYDMAHVLQALRGYAEARVGSCGEHRRLGSPTLSVGMIDGGVSVNTVPDRCTIAVDRRVLPGESPTAAYEHAAAYLRANVPADVTLEIAAPHLVAGGLNDDSNGQLAQRLRETAERCGYASESIGVPYGTDAAEFAAAGVPTVVFGPGDIAQAHTADEWVAISQLESAANVYTEFARTSGELLSSEI